MVKHTTEVEEGHYREEYGRYYEEFDVGDVYEHRPGRTITQTDNIWFTNLTMNAHPLHFNEEYGSESEFGECIINSTLTLAVITGMSVSDLSYKAVANLGWDNVDLINPVFAGDTLYAESEVLSKRVSSSRPKDGIVTVETTGLNQSDDEVISFERTILVPKKEEE
jgi:itaconyl-CoA hydratase